MSVTIASTRSAELLAGLHALTFERGWDAIEFERLLSLPNTFALAALAPEPVGFVLAWRAGDEGEILAMGTLPEQRRRGVGRALLSGAIEALAQAGATAILLEVREDNAAARALYGSAGFAQHGVRKGYYAAAEGAHDALLLRRDIANATD